MRKIDPKELLDCLDSLLGLKGGIKGENEVKRMADLMTKFSKKLVSKCIYIQILKNTDPELLITFMAEGGWAMVFQWLDESIGNSNHALIREILELLLICPISLDRLKENNCPKVVKGLSKDSEVEEVRRLACKLVEKWLKFIKSGQAAISDVAMAVASGGTFSKAAITVSSPRVAVVTSVPSTLTSTNSVKKVSSIPKRISRPGLQILKNASSSDDEEEEQEEVDEEEDGGEGDGEEEEEKDDEEFPPVGSLPLYKITVRNGKNVLAKVGTKTLSLPIAKKSENETDVNSVTSVILKSDPISKKFRYVTKHISDKDKIGGNDPLASEYLNREKSDKKTEDVLRTAPIVCVQRVDSSEPSKRNLSDSDSLDSIKHKTVDGVYKSVSSKSSKDGKVKDSHIKQSKSHRDRDRENKSDLKYKVKEKIRESEKDKKRSDHKTHSSEKGKDKEKDRDRDRDKNKSKDSSKDRHKDSERSKSRDKDGRPKEVKDSKPSEKSLTAAEKAQIQAEKDKDTLERLKTPAISILGKIPKKSSSLISPNASSTDTKSTASKPVESAQSGEKVSKPNSDVKKASIESRTSKDRPKTVKTFHSKFRSTGLEEEIKPPPSRSTVKKKIEEKRPPLKMDSSSKHSMLSAAKDEPPEKKSKVSEILADLKKEKAVDKPGAIKLIPPKPKPTLLESDMFSDALTASTKLEPRKRKRKVSNSRDGPDVKKEVKDENAQEVTSPKEIKPALKFYRDTLEDDEEKGKENEVKTECKAESDSESASKTSSSEEPSSKLYPNGVLVYKTKKGPKKSVKWKEEADLTTIRYFELDENERVNVTRNFVDMKLMERSHEREAFQLARKLATDDIMEERIPWGPLYEVDIPPDRQSSVEPGRSSQEKSVQYAREKTVLQAIYFHRNSIPDSPAEPDVEIHPTTDPKIIPLDDITGNSDTVANFQNIPWPEPKMALVPSSPPQQQQQPQQLQHPLQGPQQPPPQQQQQPQPQGFAPGYSTVGNFAGFPAVGMPGIMPPGQGTWRTGDGKDMGMNMTFQPNGPMCPQMNQPPNMFNPHGPDGFNMNGPPMGNFGGGFPMNCDPSMYGPPPMNMGGPPPPQWNRGWQGGGGGGRGGGHYMGMNMPPKFQKGVCHHFAKFGNCARGNTCRFMHPN